MNIECWFPTPVLLHQVDDGRKDIISSKVKTWATEDNIKQYLISSADENLTTSYHASNNFIELCDLLEL